MQAQLERKPRQIAYEPETLVAMRHVRRQSDRLAEALEAHCPRYEDAEDAQ